MPRTSPTRSGPFAALAAIAVAMIVAPAASAQRPVCDKVASPFGSDGNAGTVAAPYQSVQKLALMLAPGHTGCLRAGTYVKDVKVTRGGNGNGRITIRNYPGERATVRGRLWIAKGADYVTVENLYLDGANATNLPSPTINANYTTFRRNDVTNGQTAICFNVGHSTYGIALFTTIELNRVHHCGRLPSTNHDHGVYISRATATTIRNNWIYENADRGIQLYPNAQLTSITGNVIDGNGMGVHFGGSGGDSSDYTQVEGNAISNSKLRDNVESHYDAGVPPGQNNVVTRNCVSGGVRDNGDGGIEIPNVGFGATSNVIAPVLLRFVNRAAGDYRLAPGSACAAVVPGASIVPGPIL